MKKTRLGCTILEGSDVANLPLVSQNAQILDTEIDKVEKKGILTEKKITETNKNILDIEKDINERWGKKPKRIDGMDLDTLIDSGVYVGNTLTNAPGDYFCYVEVIGFYSTSGAYQRVRTWGSNGKTYERNKTNANWSEWKQVANEDDVKKAMDRADAAFQSASEGKKVMAGAITGKGVPTNPTDTFQKMATNIGAIETDKTGDATALVGDIAKGKTAYGKGKKLVGTLELTGNALVDKVLKGSTFYSNDLKKKLVGTMPDHGIVGKIISTQGGQVKLEGGYYGYVSISAQFANLIPSNIKEGINVGGVIGDYEPTPRFKEVYVDRLDQREGKDIVHFPEVKGKPIAIAIDLFYFPVYGRTKGKSYFEENPFSKHIGLSYTTSDDVEYKINITASTTSVYSTMTPSGNYYVEGIKILYLLD